MPLTRRSFIQRVGVAGGAGLAYGALSSLDLAPTAAADSFKPLTGAARPPAGIGASSSWARVRRVCVRPTS